MRRSELKLASAWFHYSSPITVSVATETKNSGVTIIGTKKTGCRIE